MERVDVIIAGAGVVGLAVAAELAGRLDGADIVVLERHAKFGQDTSSRNSEVMHAGMYYPSGSLKARHCVAGNPMLYEFCERYDIPHKRLGKVIVARDESEIKGIEAILEQGQTNGVADLRLLTQAEVAKLEPNVTAVAAVYSPNTGIIDSHRLMLQLERLATQAGAMFAYKHAVTGVSFTGGEYEVAFEGPEGADALACRWLVNCAGLYADRIPAWLGIDTVATGYKIYPVKGEYFSLSAAKSRCINGLVYPPPLKGLRGLGTHVTKSLDGRARLGPSAFYVDYAAIENYDVDPDHREEFFQAAQTYLPFIERDDLAADMAGMRPKLQAPDAPVADFVIRHEADRGLPGLIDLIGIESPGLTSCLSIAKTVAEMVEGK